MIGLKTYQVYNTLNYLSLFAAWDRDRGAESSCLTLLPPLWMLAGLDAKVEKTYNEHEANLIKQTSNSHTTIPP
jgi:hypothetical protein